MLMNLKVYQSQGASRGTSCGFGQGASCGAGQAELIIVTWHTRYTYHSSSWDF